MNETTFDRKKTTAYLLWTFGLAWAVELGVAELTKNDKEQAGQLLMVALMFVPTIGTLLSGNKLDDLGWKPGVRENKDSLLLAWFGPALLTAIGAVLYFLVFPDQLDFSGDAITQMGGAEAMEQMAEKGLTGKTLLLLAAVSTLTYAPLINAIPALGEEIGWRGFLYPQLKAKFGRMNGRLLGGLIWGAWHWPLIWLIGYEYGKEYKGFPVVGMLLFCLFTVAAGALEDWVYERSGTIWAPALLHGAINAVSTLPLAMCLVNEGPTRLLGPAPVGLLAGLPFLLTGAALLKRPGRAKE